MKILIITKQLGYYSGWDRYSLDLTEQLLRKGLEVVVVCHRRNHDLPGIPQWELLADPLDFKLNYLGVPWYWFKLWRRRRSLSGIDACHCFVESYGWFTSIISWWKGVPYFVTVHGSYGLKTLVNPLYRRFQLWAYRQATAVICVSEFTRDQLLKIVQLINITVIPNGVNYRPIDYSSAAAKKEPVILSVGALKHRKGFHLVIESLPLVLPRYPKLKYIVVGSDDDRKYTAYLKQLVAKLNLTDQVVFLKDQTPDALDKLYQRAKLFVLTPISTRYDFEGFGLVYLEANLYGLPVIGTKNSGAEQAIKDGVTGLLVEPNQPQTLATAIVRLLADETLYQKMSLAAYDWSKVMSWDRISENYLKLYQAVSSPATQ